MIFGRRLLKGTPSEPTGMRPATSTDRSYLPLADVHVIVVDDRADACELLKMALTYDGATVETCQSALDALEMFRHRAPDVLVCDLVMPRQSGYWLMQEIRKLPPNRGGRVGSLAITAYGTEVERQRALRAGFDQYVVRPIERWELCRIVATLAGRARGRQRRSA